MAQDPSTPSDLMDEIEDAYSLAELELELGMFSESKEDTLTKEVILLD